MTTEGGNETVELREIRPRERCYINGYLCEVIRQARRTTFVREIGGRLEGNVTVQMARKSKVARAAISDGDAV